MNLPAYQPELNWWGSNREVKMVVSKDRSVLTWMISCTMTTRSISPYVAVT